MNKWSYVGHGEVSKDMGMGDGETVETNLNNTISSWVPKPLQSRDSNLYQQNRVPRGPPLSIITLTLLDKALITGGGNPMQGNQVNINCTNNCIAWTTEKSFCSSKI
jgi:hypothetical protein